MSYIPKDAVTQAFKSNKGVLTPNQIIELDNENKFTKFGQLELIETQTVSSVSTFEFADLKDYNVHFLTVSDAKNSDSGKGLAFRFFESGTLESSNVYLTARQTCGADGTFSDNRSTGQSTIRLGDNTDIPSAARGNINGYMYLYDLLDSTKSSNVTYHSTGFNNTPRGEFRFGSGVLAQQSYVNKIQGLSFDTGTITGDFSLYGIRFA